MSNLAITLIVILILLLFGGLGGGSVIPYWGYGYGFGHSGVGVVGGILIVLVVLLLMGRLKARRLALKRPIAIGVVAVAATRRCRGRRCFPSL